MSQPSTTPPAAGHNCSWCNGACHETDLTRLLDDSLRWLWDQLANTADRRGDPDLTTGTAKITAPAEASHRAAAVGLLGGRALKPGQDSRVNLADLTRRLRTLHPTLTPGVVSAHTAGRALAIKARADQAKRHTLERLRRYAITTFDAIPETAAARPDMHQVWPLLRRSGWVARLAAVPQPETTLQQAAAVLAALPQSGQRLDRRRLADTAASSPHALDHGVLPGLVLAILTATGTIPMRLRHRAAWEAAGVDCDDLTGGLVAIGIYPHGWNLPPAAAVTLPPRELRRSTWPLPENSDDTVFVTENPSDATAAGDLADAEPGGNRPIRLLCTSGTPSALEIQAIARLAEAGWNLAVRADFDEAGLQHVDALLRGVPGSRPWRMGAVDYRASLATTQPDERVQLGDRPLPATPWDPALHAAMTELEAAAYEEALIDVLLEDLTAARAPEQPTVAASPPRWPS
jgi:uncharacterized protein (TIGR02679 family)